MRVGRGCLVRLVCAWVLVLNGCASAALVDLARSQVRVCVCVCAYGAIFPATRCGVAVAFSCEKGFRRSFYGCGTRRPNASMSHQFRMGRAARPPHLYGARQILHARCWCAHCRQFDCDLHWCGCAFSSLCVFLASANFVCVAVHCARKCRLSARVFP
jgi:hypothetical protein